MAFIIRRLLTLAPTLVAVSLITFALMHVVPGGPWDEEKTLPPAVVENLNRRYGLDQPLWEQYVSFISRALRGDLGVSFTRQNQGVTEILLKGLPVTATVAALAFALALVAGLSLGIVAALRQNSWVDYVSVTFATLGASTPNFVLGIMLVLLLAVTLKLVPTGGWGTVQQLVLPVLTLMAFPAAYIARVTRASMLDVIRQDYIRTARAKGLPERTVILRHALRNALIPVLTVAGPIAANLITGSFIIETLYSIPGVGRLFVQSVFARDYGLIMGSTLFFTLVISVANLVVDILYAVVDPRIRLQ